MDKTLSLGSEGVQATITDDPRQAEDPLRNPLAGLATFLTEATGQIASLEETNVPIGQRCAGCVITCAANIRRNDGTV